MRKPIKRIKQRTTREDTFCLIDNLEPQFPVVEISADGFSFACDRADTRFRQSTRLTDISIVNGEAQEIIHASGVIRHRSSFDARRDRVGISFTFKRFEHSISGRVRLPRRRPSLPLDVTLTRGKQATSGTVVDYNVRSARLEMTEQVPAVDGVSVGVTIVAGTRVLYSGGAVVIRSEDESTEIVLEFSDNLLELRSISLTEKALFTTSIIDEKRAELAMYASVGSEYKALVFDWHMYLEMVEEVLDREEAKGLLASYEDERRYLEQVIPPVFEHLRCFIAELNRIVPSIEPDQIPAHKQLLHATLEPFLLGSPLASSIMDKMHGYNGDYETVKLFFSEPFMGSSLFGKLMNRFIMSLEPVTAHVNRIFHVYRELADLYHASDQGIRVVSLGSGPAEEILRLLREHEPDKPVHIALIDQDAHALADFYERVQPWLQPDVEIALVNFNIINILVGKTTDLTPGSYDIAYCAGMFDYFKDRFCRKFVEFMIDLIKESGSFIYTNVHSRNFARYFMDFGGGWEIYHRDESTTRDLAPHPHLCKVSTDETGTNVFVKGTPMISDPHGGTGDGDGDSDTVAGALQGSLGD